MEEPLLHLAIKSKHVDLCKVLIQHRADVSQSAVIANVGQSPVTPIQMAVRFDNREICEVLLQNGIRITEELVNQAQGSLRQYLDMICNPQLHRVIGDPQDGPGELEDVRKRMAPLLNSMQQFQRSAFLQEDKDGKIPLHIAAGKGNTEAGLLLISELNFNKKFEEEAPGWLSISYYSHITFQDLKKITRDGKDLPLHLAAQTGKKRLCEGILQPSLSTIFPHTSTVRHWPFCRMMIG